MQFSKLLSVAVGLLATAEAVSVYKPRIAARGSQQKYNLKLDTVQVATPSSASAIRNMIIQDIVTRSAVDSKNGTTIFDDSISFTFIDPNSNTSTACNDDFQGTATTTQFPTGWVPCNNNGNLMDDFYWQFTSYQSLTSFSIELIHAFVGSNNAGEVLRSADIPITLTCADVNHVDGCFSNQVISLPIAIATA
ncbi:d072bf5d-6ebf-4e6a-97e8-aca7680bcc3d [Sclerotinia trifoliorum]|uniref:D072bf5d-6ebf-4e6a-97e8-aca7680bcc3d n=1 Tax=Sclerotinia trifoliorum TaxID=28548 RepID=A0A8H2VQ01_9HELO|nr:d072bf5d-6ebf-4e6a-97e8-aca7680bcc3d [Sclerotinia trifoliorum]